MTKKKDTCCLLGCVKGKPKGALCDMAPSDAPKPKMCTLCTVREAVKVFKEKPAGGEFPVCQTCIDRWVKKGGK